MSALKLAFLMHYLFLRVIHLIACNVVPSFSLLHNIYYTLGIDHNSQFILFAGNEHLGFHNLVIMSNASLSILALTFHTKANVSREYT